MPLEALSDHFIMQMYENIRDHVHADAMTGSYHVGQPEKQRAGELRSEIERRGLFSTPIEWPDEKHNDC